MNTWSFMFFFNSILMGTGLAMDAFSVSLANGLSEPKMKKAKMCAVAGTFSGFQMLMPLIGWICVHTVAEYFRAFETIIPWIALALLGYIGGKMIFEGTKSNSQDNGSVVSFKSLVVQGLATAIDALSVGFTISEYKYIFALVESLIIGLVTFLICLSGLAIGKKFGTKLAGKATVLGGIILIAIGIEIFVKALVS